MTDKPMPADWARKRALEEAYGDSFGDAFARYIEKHEQPPVDPDLLDVRRILAAWAGHTHFKEEMLAGKLDAHPDFKRALAEYKKIKGERG